MTRLTAKALALASSALDLPPGELRVEPFSAPWLRILTGHHVRQVTKEVDAAEIVVAQHPKRLVPPLLLSPPAPPWENCEIASALLRVEMIGPDQGLNPEEVATALRFALGGPRGALVTEELADRTLRDRRTYRQLENTWKQLELGSQGMQWRARFAWAAGDGSVEAWQVMGSGFNVGQAECSIWFPPGSWPGLRAWGL